MFSLQARRYASQLRRPPSPTTRCPLYVRVSEVGGSWLARTGTDGTAGRRGPRLQSKPAGNRAADASSEGNDATDNPDARFDSRDLLQPDAGRTQVFHFDSGTGDS